MVNSHLSAMIGLIDCNNFFVSCERVFNPSLRRRPVIVFSNNDGCAVSLSNEAKALGIKRGDPFFKISKLCEANGIATLSGNHRLYGDMSSRVMATIASMVEDIEVYSIDEAFLSFEGMPTEKLPVTGTEIVRRVRRATGIPTSLGIAHTKTLAKIASRFAKLYQGYNGCCIIDSDDKRRKALEMTPAKNVWGIGRHLAKKLADHGIVNALQVADMNKKDVDELFNIAGEKTWRELNGEPCIDFHQAEPARKQMCCSRSFSKGLTSEADLGSAIAALTDVIGRKLREQRMKAVALSVFIHTDAFNAGIRQYFNSTCRTLPEPASDTPTLTYYTSKCLRSIFRKGHAYKKAGVVVMETVDENHIQQSLFCDPADRMRKDQLMAAVDMINNRFKGNDAIHMASYKPIDNFVRREHLSRHFTTRLSDIIGINCNHGS